MRHLLFLSAFCLSLSVAGQQTHSRDFRTPTGKEECHFSNRARSPYFVLEPGYQLALKGVEGTDTLIVVYTVLTDTKKIGNVETRVILRHEKANGKVRSNTHMFVAFCRESGNMCLFGEEVTQYKDGKEAGTKGSWTAEGNTKYGVLAPGHPEPGDRWYRQYAPKVAMDRSEVVSLTETVQVPAGRFTRVVKTEESSPLAPGWRSYRYYAPGVGIIREGNLVLVRYGDPSKQ